MAEPSRSFEAFTADLAREAQALGITPTNHLAAAREPQVSPSERLRDRGYLDKMPPPVSKQGSLGPEQEQEFNAYMRPRIDTLKALGVPGPEAYDLIREMPDVRTLFERLGQEGQQDPRVQEEIRRLFDRMR